MIAANPKTKGESMSERTIVSFDYAIKYLLRDKADFDILSGFLSELLNRDVEVLAILESESNKDKPAGKTNRVDLKAQIDNKEFAVFEIQFRESVDFFSRVLFGTGKAIVEQVSAGEDLYDVKKIYSVNIAYYNFDAKSDYLFSCKIDGFRGVHSPQELIRFEQVCDINNPLSPKTDIHPEYYLILPKMFDEHLRGGFNEWMYVLKKSAVRSDSTAKGIEKAAQKLDYLKMTDDEKKAYDEYLSNRSSTNSAIHTAKIKGFAEGEKIGIEQGIEKGKIEGKIEDAMAMKAEGISNDVIARVTKLSIDEIKKL